MICDYSLIYLFIDYSSHYDQIPNYGRVFFEIPKSLEAWNKFGLYDEKAEVSIIRDHILIRSCLGNNGICKIRQASP
jgi:hypothetical protein